MNRRYKVLPTAGAILALLLVGCPSVPRKAPPEAAPPPAPTVPREGRPFSIVSNESLLTVAVRRAGALARVGHNHIIASRSLTGTAWVADDPARSSFDIRIPVRELTVDEPELRALAGEEFSAPVPDSAREGTRENMLSSSLLDAARFPDIVLRSQRLEQTADGVRAHVQATVRDQVNSLVVPLRYTVDGDELHAQGEIALRHSDIGLEPFSVLGGALRVHDEMHVTFRVTARAARAP